MKKMMKRLAQGATRLLILALGLGLAATGWAVVPVPTVVWESGEFESSKTGTDGQTYSISRNNLHTINGSGNIVIGEGAQGVTINLPSNPSDSVSVLVKYSSTTTAPVANAALATIYMSAQYDIGAIVRTSGSSSVNGYYSSASKTEPEKATYTFSSGLTLSQGTGVMLLSHGIDPANTVRGTAFYTGATVSSMTAGGNVAGLQWTHKNGTRTISYVAIGGPTRNNVGVNAWNGMVIEKIAVFVNGYYTGTELADYRWPSEIKAVLPERDMINLNISNGDGYAITGSGVDTISTLAGEMLDNAWQNTPSGNAVVSGDARNGRVTGVTAYDGTSKESTTLSDVTFTWAVEGSGTANYGNVDIENNPTFHKAWLARFSKAAETSSILVQSIPYRKYDIIVYCFGADDSAFNPVFVNGVPYVGDTSLATDTNTRKATSSSETWGGRRASPSLGQTAIMLKGLENPELSLTIRSGATSICAVQILRDMSEGVWPTSKKVISLNLMSAYSSSGTTPAIYGLEPVPNEAWTKDGLNSISSSGTDVSATIKEWNGTSAVDATGVTVNEKAANAYGWSGYTYAPQNQILSGYLDDGGERATITVTSVPYAVYDVIVYMATDTENRKFGPVKVNDVPYRWDDNSGEVMVADSANSTATTRWGASRSRLPAYGLNAMRIPNQTRSTLTIIGANNENNARGGIAAIQIVEAEAYSGLKVYSNGSWSGGTEPTSGDAVIVLDGDTALAIDGTASLDTVTITGTGTLTLSGSGKFTATTIEVDSLATVNANPDRLDATTYVGSGTVVYSGGTPETGKGWTDSANWTGTVEIKGKASTTPTLKFADYGNSESVVCVNGFEAYVSLDEGAHAVKEIKIGSDGFTQAGAYGYNATKDFVIPAKLTGSGTYTVYMTDNATKTTYFTGDVSEFSGTIAFDANAESSRVVIGESTDRIFKNQSLIVASDCSLTVRKQWGFNGFAGGIFVDENGLLEVASSGFLPSKGGFTVDGTLRTAGLNYNSLGHIAENATYTAASVLVNDTGVLELTSSADTSEADIDYSKITGTGILKFYSTAGYRTFPIDDNKMPATTLTIQTEVANSLVITKNNGETVIGNLAGSKNIRSDWYDNGSNGRTLTVTQSKDTKWDGKFVSNRITQFNVVPPAEGTPGTLMLNGTHTETIPMQINGSVKLTGMWVGATTVSGTFGGTGTLTGDLTFNAGSTFKAFSSDSDGLSVSGTVAYPATGTVTVDVDALGSPESDVVLISNSGLDGTKFALKAGTPVGYALKVEGDAMKLKANATVAITVPAVANTTVTVTAGGEPVEGENGVYAVPYGSAVVVTYAAANGYELSGTATYNVANATENTTITITDTVANPYVARVRNFSTSQNDQYTTLAAAVAAADGTTHASSITLIANVSEPEVTVSSALMIMGNFIINADIKIAEGGQLQLMQATLSGKLTIENGGVYVTVGGALSELVAKDGASIQLTTLNETTAPLSVSTLTVEGKLTVISSYGSAVRGTTYKAISYITANATIAQNAEITGVNEWSASVEPEGDNKVIYLAITKVAVVDGVYYDDAQDAVDAAVSSGKSVSFLVASGTVKIGVGETLIVSGATLPTVVLDDDLTAPYEVVHTVDTVNILNTYTVVKYAAKLINPRVGTTLYEDEVKYISFVDAIADVVEQTQAVYADYMATVTLLDDVTLDATLTVNKKMILNLNGKALTASGFDAINNTTRMTIQGTGSVTATSGGSVVLTTSGATVTVSAGATLSPTPTTTVANSYAKLTGSTYSVDAYNVITINAPNATVTRTDTLGTAIKDGDTITFTVAAGSGYVVSGVTANDVAVVPDDGVYSVPVTENTTIAVATVQNASISDVTFDYYASYTNADVTARVGCAGRYTLSVQGKDYVANAEGAGTVTFTNVDVSNTELGSGVAYTITATGAATGSTSGTSEQKKGTVVDGSGWMLYNKTKTDVGSWTDGDGTAVTPPDYGDNDYASLSGTNVYSATGVSTGDVVTVTTVVAFGGAADSSVSIDADAQAALRVYAGESGNTFQVYTAGPAWVDVGNDDLGAPVDDQRYTVTLRIDYGIQKFFLDITKDETVYSLTNAAGQSGFALASGASGMRQVQYKGAGSFVSIEGSNILTGYMADVGTEGNVTNVAVSADFVSEYLATKKASEVPALLRPSAARDCANGLNYFESYALGLDPTEEDDKLVVDVSTDASGNFVFTVKHPTFDEQGNINGYEEIDAADNVQATVTYKYGMTVGGEEDTIQGDTISPSEMFKNQSGNVLYYKAEVSIGAK